ncbi:MAG: hypothetical protein C7B46_13230 [Sulfobacillus benefaciens]|uniref:Uncharacterized protein n=1 Tax=Sulfobacillus benefaciens TaxID=453960 RepID=A0A2T2XDW9_9FIRM|nr:MAG: hypothetical protein C7B46_13230 [Sulfobacillus benefaciens]
MMTIQQTRTPVDPAPLAFGAFALTTFLLSCVNIGAIGVGFLPAVVAVAWFFGGAVQVLVAMWELAHDKLFPAVAFGSYGAFWISFAIFQTFYAMKVPANMAGSANALFLGVWCVVTLYLLVGAFRTHWALAIAFVLVELTLVLLTIGFASGSLTATHLGGWAGIALAVVVWYIAAAEVINHQFGRVLLPLGHFTQRSNPGNISA